MTQTFVDISPTEKIVHALGFNVNIWFNEYTWIRWQSNGVVYQHPWIVAHGVHATTKFRPPWPEEYNAVFDMIFRHLAGKPVLPYSSMCQLIDRLPIAASVKTRTCTLVGEAYWPVTVHCIGCDKKIAKTLFWGCVTRRKSKRSGPACCTKDCRPLRFKRYTEYAVNKL